MKTKITLNLDSVLLRQAKTLAAKEGTSIGALLTEYLKQIVRKPQGYDRARKRALARLRKGMGLNWTPPRSRGEVHER
jgi:hypothetical protein